MPREKIPDPTTPGRWLEVNWRRGSDTDPDEPRYVQLATRDEGHLNDKGEIQAWTAAELIGWAIALISSVDAEWSPPDNLTNGERAAIELAARAEDADLSSIDLGTQQSEEWREAAHQFLLRAASRRTTEELMGVFAQLGPVGLKQTIRTLHKARGQAYGFDTDHGSAAELAESGPPSIPRAGELPVPGATGYPIAHLDR